MKLRKYLLLFCATLLLVLFTDGLSALVQMNAQAQLQPGGRIERTESGGESGQHDTEYTGSQKVTDRRPVNFLILGLDEEGVRSDVIALLNCSPSAGKLNILSIARDTKVRSRGKTVKINALIGMGGEKLIINKVEEITGLPVHYYVTLDFRGFRKIVDTLDGVVVNVPINMNYDDPDQNLHIHLKQGVQLLDGIKAEQFVRYRKSNTPDGGYTDGDLGRIKAQQEFMKALIEQKLRLKYLSKADDVFFILSKYMRTNIEIGDVNYYLKNIKHIKYDDIKSYTIPGDSVYTDEIWYFIYNSKETRKLIDTEFFKD